MMHVWRRVRAFYLMGVVRLFFIVLLLAGCTSSNRNDGFFYYRLNATPSTLDPALIADVSGASVAAKLFNGLVKLDDHLSVAPDIAERWHISKDGLKYTFMLKRGVRFSNDRQVTAQDFKTSFERVLNSRTRSPNVWVFDKVEGSEAYREGRTGDITGFRVIDDFTFEIKLKRPFSPFLSMLTTTPAYVVAVDVSSCLGTGPFVLASWMPGRELVLERKDDYFDGRAKVRGIVYRIIPEG